MFRLKERTKEEGVAHHCGNPVRVYESDGVQAIRVARTRAMLERAIGELAGNVPKLLERRLDVIEGGCGTGDITGPASERHRVTGVDCHEAAVAEARRRFPYGHWLAGEVEGPCFDAADVVVLCEVLEHVEEPEALVRKWLPRAQASVISHPLGEPAGSGLSGGDHCWSFSEADFRRWFELGGHELVEMETFEMGSYHIVLGRGRREL